MKGKISKIKNTKGELALPITTVEAVYMEDGTTKLSDEIKDVLKYEAFDDEGIIAEIPSVIEEIDGIKKNIGEINSSLETKANIVDVFFKNNGININDFDEETRSTFLNAQGIDVNYVLGENNVKEINTTFLLPSKNLFNITNSTLNKYVYSGSGALGDNSAYDTTEFIKVKANTSYSHNFSNGNYAYYDVNKNFISGGTSLALSFTTPENCYYIRKSYKKDGLKSMLVEGNTIPISYIPYEFSLDEKIQIKAQSITDECKKDIYSNIIVTAENTDFINVSPNLINPSNITLNKYVYSGNGGLGDNNDYDVTEFIELKEGIEYSTNCSVGTYAYYNKEKTFVSGGNSLSSLFTIPQGIKYLRKSIHKNVTDRFISESSKSTKYNPYGEKKLDESIKVLNSHNSKWMNKRWYVIGDSITYANTYMNGYAKVVRDILGCDITIDAISGQTLSTMCDRVTNETIGDQDLVTIMCCMNDFKNTEIGTINDTTNTTFYGNLYLAIKKILTIKPTVRLVFITSQRAGDNEYFPQYDTENSKGYKQVDYVNAVKNMCEKYGIPVLDLYSVSGINEYTFSTYTDDNIHPNLIGHQLIGEIVASFLNSI